MMPSVPDSDRSILKCVDHWIADSCQMCGEFIDVRITPSEGMAQRFPWTPSADYFFLCPEHVVTLAPEANRPWLVHVYEFSRLMRVNLGLGARPTFELASTVLESLGIGSGVNVTLDIDIFSGTGKHKKPEQVPYMSSFLISGLVAEERRNIVQVRAKLSDYPLYSLVPTTEPHDPLQVAVRIGVDIRSPLHRSLAVQKFWNPETPSSPPTDYLVGTHLLDGDPKAGKILGNFVKTAWDLYHDHRTGRPAGSGLSLKAVDDAFDAISAEMAQSGQQEDVPTKSKVADRLKVDEDTVLNAIQSPYNPTVYKNWDDYTSRRRTRTVTTRTR